MNRREFMDRLEQLLSDVPVDERLDALQYYEDYFEDAGYSKEQDIIAELKSPETVAAAIKKDLGIARDANTNNEGRSEYKDYRAAWQTGQSDTYNRQNEGYNSYDGGGQQYQEASGGIRGVDKKLWIILFIITLTSYPS